MIRVTIKAKYFYDIRLIVQWKQTWVETCINSFFVQVNLRLDEELEEEGEEDEGFYDVTLPGSETEVCPQFSRIFFEQFIRVFCIPLLG